MVNLNVSKAQLKRKTFENPIMNLDFWIDIKGDCEEALTEVKYFRKFQNILDYSSIKGKDRSWNPDKIHQRMKEIELEIIEKRPNTFFELDGFSDKSNQLEFWTWRGWTPEEAAVKRKRNQSKGGVGHSKKRKEDPEKYYKCNPQRKEYWITRGFTEEDAVIKVKDRQSTFTLEKLLMKHGYPVGLTIWKQRQKQWQETLQNKSEEELNRINTARGKTFLQLSKTYGEEKAKQICKNKGHGGSYKFLKNSYGDELFQLMLFYRKPGARRHSKEANVFFETMISNCYSETKHLISECISNNEKCIHYETGRYFYDFCDVENKIIIEYHGIAFHPREGDINFKCVLSKEDYYTRYNQDQHKMKTAIDNGFSFLAIYSDEENKLETAINFIRKHLK